METLSDAWTGENQTHRRHAVEEHRGGSTSYMTVNQSINQSINHPDYTGNLNWFQTSLTLVAPQTLGIVLLIWIGFEIL